MISCLPFSPLNSWVTRIDSMISLSLRSIVRFGSWTRSSSSRRVADELLGDRRGAAAVAPERGERRGHDRDRVEPGVLPEGLVLDRGRGIEQDLRDLLERDDLALGIAEAGQFDLAGPVVDDGLLGEHVIRQLRWRRSSPALTELNSATEARAAMAPRPARKTKMMMAIQPAVFGLGASGGSSGRHGGGRTP